MSGNILEKSRQIIGRLEEVKSGDQFSPVVQNQLSSALYALNTLKWGFNNRETDNSPEQYLRLALENARTRRAALARGPSHGAEMPILEENLPNAFYLELRSLKASVNNPQEFRETSLLIQTLAKLDPKSPQEKLSAYIERHGGTAQREEEAIPDPDTGKKIIRHTLTLPLSQLGSDQIALIVQSIGLQIDNGFSIKEETIDLKIPFELLIPWLE